MNYSPGKVFLWVSTGEKFLVISKSQTTPSMGVIFFRNFLFLLVGYFINSLVTEQLRQNHRYLLTL
jgi:hypothetical protein